MPDRVQRSTLHALASLLAVELAHQTGETWRVRLADVDDDQAAIIADADEAAVTIEPAREPGRLVLEGNFWLDGEDWSAYRDDRDRKRRRTVAWGWTPVQIARAIVDRLLPAYRAALRAGPHLSLLPGPVRLVDCIGYLDELC
jgi:hypothetical protein